MHGTGEGLPSMRRDADGICHAASHIATAFRALLLALALIISGPVLAAGFACAPAPDSGKNGALDELEEVVITGQEAASDPRDMRAWLRLLVGQYTYEGHVDLCGRNNASDLRAVTGTASCIGAGATPNVHCTVNVRWPAARGENGAPVPGGVSNLFPSLVVYSLELLQADTLPSGYRPIDHWRIMFMQLDNKGIAEWGAGELTGDTFMSREPCVGMPGNCRKITRITVKPDSNEMSILVTVEVDSQRVLRQTFLLHREPSSRTEQSSGEPRP